MTAAVAQTRLDELGMPLSEVTFVVVDLETTGDSAADDAITEIGAVKVRGGEVLGEFQTLVQPGASIPPFIAVLTGITDAMVAGAPRIDAVLPAFVEFVRGAVLVAHNAPFDLGFLRVVCARAGVDLPHVDTLDTARLARRVLTRDEAPDCRLATLARVFRAGTEPCHRALADARATVDVLHGLIGHVGNLGVHSLEDLRGFSRQVTPEQRRKRHLAEGLPTAPGVYLFTDERGRVLYVGKSSNLRARVRAYFTCAETRSRMSGSAGSRPAGDRSPALRRRARGDGRDSYARPWTHPRRERGGDGVHAALAGDARRAPRRAGRHVVLTGVRCRATPGMAADGVRRRPATRPLDDRRRLRSASRPARATVG